MINFKQDTASNDRKRGPEVLLPRNDRWQNTDKKNLKGYRLQNKQGNHLVYLHQSYGHMLSTGER